MSRYVRFYKEPTIDEWAKASLSPSELIDFQNSFEENHQIWRQYTDNGLISVEPIYETFLHPILGEYIEVLVGEQVIIAPETSVSSLHIAERYQYWLNRYTQDTGSDFVQFVANVA
jgi:hypothetical protein